MTASSELRTIRDFLRYATTSFNKAGLYFGHGTDNAWDEAVALVTHCLHLTSDVGPEVLDAALLKSEKEEILTLIEKRVTNRLPLAYLTKEAWFSGLQFYVDERVLVPRSPIAELIENEFQPWVDPDNVTNVLDICTGSGCIAIAMAYAFPEAAVDACDISEDALAVAKTNVLRHQVEDQVTLYKSDLLDAVPNKKYDIIVSNPPYVCEEEMADLPKEYLHEPALGLKADEDGLALVNRILNQAADYLSDNGILVIEVGNSEVALMNKYEDVPFTWVEFERGDGGVFLLTAEQVKSYFAI